MEKGGKGRGGYLIISNEMCLIWANRVLGESGIGRNGHWANRELGETGWNHFNPIPGAWPAIKMLRVEPER